MRRSATRSGEHWRWIWVVTLALVAFGLRLVNLEARSLWLDEGFSLLRIQADWQTLFANVVDRQGFKTLDIHPPLYFALVKAWSLLAGSQVFTWRLFSAFCSTLLVPATMVFARRIAGRRAEGVAGVLAALSPAYLWYAAEVRMYALVALLGCIGAYFALRALTRPRASGKDALSWLIVSTVAGFTHYSLLIAVAIQAVFVLRSFWRAAYEVLKHPAVWIPLLATAGLVAGLAILFAQPTVQAVIALLNQAILTPSGREVDPIWFVKEVGGALAFGLNAGDPTGEMLIWLFWAVVLLGLIWQRQGDVTKQAFLLCALALPFAAWLILARLIENSPSFRYVAFVFPVAHVLIARGVALSSQHGAPGKALAVAAAALAVGVHLFGARMTHTPTPTWQDDWRGVAGYLRQHLRPGDGVLLGIHASEAALSYYLGWATERFEGVGKWHAMPLPEAQAALRQRYPRIWVVLAGSEEDFWNRFALALVEPYALVREVPFPARTTALSVRLYDTLTPAEAKQPALPVGQKTTCLAQLCIADLSLARPTPEYSRPGFGLMVRWASNRTPHAGRLDALPQSLSVRLEHQGETWLDFQLNADLDGAQARGLDGKDYRAFYNVPLWVGLPPLPYRLVVSAVSADGRTLHSAAAQLDVPTVLNFLRVARSESLPLWQGREIELMAAEVSEAVQQGSALPVVLTWRTRLASTPSWLNRLVLLDERSQVRAAIEREMQDAAWSVTQWPASELVRDQYVLPTAELPPGAYRLVLQRERGGHLLNELTLATIQIVEPPLAPIETRFDHIVNAEVGELTLLGYSVEKPPNNTSPLTVTTFWRTNQTPKADARLFVHLLDGLGNPVAQDDGAPFNGARTTLSLRPGEGVRQAHVLRLPEALAAGRYRLFAGAYNSTDLERWPVTQNGQPGQHNLVFLGEIELP